jgi:hypothetical protein
MLRAQPEPDERHVRPFPLGRRADVLDVDLARDDLMAQPDHHLRKELEPIAPLVRDQNA